MVLFVCFFHDTKLLEILFSEMWKFLQFMLFLFPSCNMLVQCTNAGLFPFYQYTCKLLSSKVTSEVLFNCLFIFASSCMVVPSACCCSLHFHAVCQYCFVSKLGCKCVGDIPSYLPSASVCVAGFLSPGFLLQPLAWEGLQLKGWKLQPRTEAFLRHEVRTSVMPFCWQSHAWGPGTLRYCVWHSSIPGMKQQQSAAFWKTSPHQPFCGGRREADVSAWSQRGEWCEHVPVPVHRSVMNDAVPPLHIHTGLSVEETQT